VENEMKQLIWVLSQAATTARRGATPPRCRPAGCGSNRVMKERLLVRICVSGF